MKKIITALLVVLVLVVLAVLYVYLGSKSYEQLPVLTEDDFSKDAVIASSTVEEEIEPVSDVSKQPAIIALDVKSWEWVRATYTDGRTISPNTAGDFVMTFSGSGGVSFSTDCNSMSSSYEAYSGGLTFGPIASTKMYCEGSKETEFAALIAETTAYSFTEAGMLELQTISGDTLLFK